MIGGAPNGDWYGAYAMDGSGSLNDENAERSIFRCASSRYGSGEAAVTPKSEVFRASLATLPVVDTSAEFRRRKEDCGGMEGLEFEALQFKITLK